MHVVFLNGSPRVEKFSNTNRIIDAFAEGLHEKGWTSEKHAISNRNNWDAARTAFAENKLIIIALPLYVECVPGLLIEFLETLEPKNDGTRIGFILQCGFSEGCQLRLGEKFLKTLPAQLGCESLGVLCKGDNFGIRVNDDKTVAKMLAPYTKMGREFADAISFDTEAARKFTGPEILPAPGRLMVTIVFKLFAKKMFNAAAQRWGCTESLEARPYKQ